MCGIIGYVGYRRPQDILFQGLKRLEYRGYDSAGLAWREHGTIERVRAVGNLDSLSAALQLGTRERDHATATVTGAVATATSTVATATSDSSDGHERSGDGHEHSGDEGGHY